MKKTVTFLLAIGLVVVIANPAFADGVYPAWQQGFEQDTQAWITDDIPGAVGWCGNITRYERGSGPVDPSAGQGYAVVENGVCNEYWMNNGWTASGPYAPFGGGYSTSWPQSGFVTELDIYLDPSWDVGTSFDYYVSMFLLNEGEFRYYVVHTVKESGALLAAGQEVAEAGWYTFRIRFRDEDGYLAVDLEIVQNGQVLFANPMATTAFYGAETSSFQVANVGTGYAWFDSISDGLQLPIDQQKYRPGK